MRLYDSRTCALGSMILQSSRRSVKSRTPSAPARAAARVRNRASTADLPRAVSFSRLLGAALTTSSLDRKGHPANQQQR